MYWERDPPLRKDGAAGLPIMDRCASAGQDSPTTLRSAARSLMLLWLTHSVWSVAISGSFSDVNPLWSMIKVSVR